MCVNECSKCRKARYESRSFLGRVRTNKKKRMLLFINTSVVLASCANNNRYRNKNKTQSMSFIIENNPVTT